MVDALAPAATQERIAVIAGDGHQLSGAVNVDEGSSRPLWFLENLQARHALDIPRGDDEQPVSARLSPHPTHTTMKTSFWESRGMNGLSSGILSSEGSFTKTVDSGLVAQGGGTPRTAQGRRGGAKDSSSRLIRSPAGVRRTRLT